MALSLELGVRLKSEKAPHVPSRNKWAPRSMQPQCHTAIGLFWSRFIGTPSAQIHAVPSLTQAEVDPFPVSRAISDQAGAATSPFLRSVLSPSTDLQVASSLHLALRPASRFLYPCGFRNLHF